MTPVASFYTEVEPENYCYFQFDFATEKVETGSQEGIRESRAKATCQSGYHESGAGCGQHQLGQELTTNATTVERIATRRMAYPTKV